VVRLSVEVQLAGIGVVVADSPADADLLIVAGEADDALAGAIDVVWAELPGPRVRVTIESPDEAAGAVGRAIARLSSAEQRTEAAERRDEWRDVGSVSAGMNDMDMDMAMPGRGGMEAHRGADDEADSDAGDEAHGHHTRGGTHDSRGNSGADGQRDDHEDQVRDARNDHAGPGGQTNHPGHGGHGHEAGPGGHADRHGYRHQMPGGLMMAHRAPDRDGLKLDVLRVPLGPVLTDWPAGLVVTVSLQGDVVQEADARLLGSAVQQQMPFWNRGDRDGDRGRRHAAAHLDSLGRLLGVVGWDALAYRARRLRDGALGDVPAERLRVELAALDRRMCRSWTLRWATDGLGVLTSKLARNLGVTGPAARAAERGGDVTARWRRWLADADSCLAGESPGDGEGPRGRLDGDRPASAALLDAALHLMVGLDIAAARIVMASFDPDTDELVATMERAAA
jgi:Ni,Fe-hydrogenase III small subunit